MSIPVVLCNGMGVDTAALFTRWIEDPASRDFDLADLIVLTAMTGNEYDVTERLMNDHILPLMREHGVRYVQLSRAGQSEKDGIAVLDDSRAPERMFMRGPWALSDELKRSGTVPQIVSGRRLCSYRAKGWVLDQWIAQNMDGPYRHVIGFAAEESERAERDSSYTTNSRSPEYPLMTWGWDRATCERYLLEQHGEAWSRSCCRYCPFQAGRAGIPALLARWAAEPAAAVESLVLEHVALMLNPRSKLFGTRTARSVAEQGEFLTAIVEAQTWIAAAPWAVYKVKRVYFAKNNDPAVKGAGWRSVSTVVTGTREEMTRLVTGRKGAGVDEHGIPRCWITRAAAPYPCVEEMLVAGPAGVDDKERPGFASAWRNTTMPQLALFGSDS